MPSSETHGVSDNRTLYLAWQDPERRCWYPVAVMGLSESGQYTFRYLQGALVAQRVSRFPGVGQFPMRPEPYVSAQLFPFLQNRVISQKRPDFDAYCERLGLADSALAHTLHAFDLLERSNGRRATDRFEVFVGPGMSGRSATFVFFTRGVRYLDDVAHEHWATHTASGDLRLLLEPQNSFDRNAVLLSSVRLVPVGFVPTYYAEPIAELLRAGQAVTAELIQHNPEPAPERFLVRLRADTLEGWRFTSSELYAPIALESHRAA